MLCNALRYSPSTTPVQVRQRANKAVVVIEVHNQGDPIPSDLLPSIFQPMNRGTKQMDLGTRSIGLGLYIVDQIAVAHGGTVGVRSAMAEGTTFTLHLPRSDG